MNTGIVFVPKIPLHLYKSGPALQNPYTNKDLHMLVKLRSEGVTFTQCATVMHRSKSNLASAVSYHNLEGAIAARKQRLLGEKEHE